MEIRKKIVVVSLWNELATTVGQELLDSADQSPIVAIKSLKVGDFQGNCYLETKFCMYLVQAVLVLF